MKLGFLTAPFPQTPLMDVADRAAGAGSEVLEIACIIEHEDRRFEGTDEKVKQGFLIARDVLRPYCK